MVQNIAITGFDRELLKKVGKALAEDLEMFYVDTIELYEFDHIPHTMTDMIKAQGLKEFRDKEIGTIGYVTDFNNAVITFESGAIKCKKNIEKLRMQHVMRLWFGQKEHPLLKLQRILFLIKLNHGKVRLSIL